MLFKQFKLDIKLIKDIDKTLLFSMIALVLYGILNIYLCTKGGKYDGFAFKQFVWLIISLVVLYIFLSIDYTIMMNYVLILLGISNTFNSDNVFWFRN